MRASFSRWGFAAPFLLMVVAACHGTVEDSAPGGTAASGGAAASGSMGSGASASGGGGGTKTGGTTASGGGSGGSSAGNGQSGGSAEAPSALASVARRLTRSELDNVVRDLFGDDTRPASKFLAEDEYSPFDNDYTLQRASQALIDSLDAFAEAVATRAPRSSPSSI